MHGAPYDLLASFLGVREDRLRSIVSRWRKAGYADTGRLGPGPAWVWLTRSGLAVTGQGFAPSPPSLARLAHLRAVLAVRLSLEAGDAWDAGQAHWRSERRLRDGGLADLLAEAAGPNPRFAAVICEDIKRSGRDTYNALKLERQLAEQGVLLFAADEHISVEGMNPTTLLIRRIKQSVAEWLRLQIKGKSWDGLVQHAIDGYNTGRAPHGYAARKVPHPVPEKAAQGLTKTRLVTDPAAAPAVAQIFAWRTEGRLGAVTITGRLNARPDLYPPPAQPAWTTSGAYAILANPKYTGHMVFGRFTTRAAPGKKAAKRPVPPGQWLWSPQPTHEAIISRETWDAAQATAAQHATTPDDPAPRPDRRPYLLRSRIRCRIDNRRMSGATPHASRTDDPAAYYVCPHRPANARHAAPDHPASVLVREDILLTAVSQFFDERVFGPERAQLLAAATPAGDTAAAAARTARAAERLTRQLRKTDAAINAQAAALTAYTESDADPTAITEMRTRTLARITELHTQRADLTAQIAALTTPDTTDHGDPDLLDELPHLAGLLAHAPQRLQKQLYDAIDLQLLYSRKHHRVTIRTTITPAAVAAIIRDHQQLKALEDGSDLSQNPGASVIRTTGEFPQARPAWSLPAGADRVRRGLLPRMGIAVRSCT
jgi:site-specific DNA recombinase